MTDANGHCVLTENGAIPGIEVACVWLYVWMCVEDLDEVGLECKSSPWCALYTTPRLVRLYTLPNARRRPGCPMLSRGTQRE
jgi:hypothetical protein